MKWKPLILLISVMLVIALAISFFKIGSGTEMMPKPRGYFRIDLPRKAYTHYDSKCPLSFDIPNYATVEIYRDKSSEDSCWFNIAFPRLKATVYCTYLPVKGNLDQLIRDSYDFVAKHEMRASGFRREHISLPDKKVYGIFYNIQGDAASQVQFFLTDSTEHFFRGSLYFFNKPNPDSIAPVLDFLKKDILHITETLEWTD
ncbi:MAG: gliding motility lipoprotein GldD [Crocinitomicaceae bacterium]|nr:gliding motility lipoprotein GldD [Crocinitomicaceae bacterium]